MLEMESIYLGRQERIGELRLKSSGKVRDIYELGPDHLVFVTSDRVSAFDVIMPQGIPRKGRVLTAIAAHWFARTKDIIPNHLVSTDVADLPGALGGGTRRPARSHHAGGTAATPTSVEWVVRGYIAGSGWKEYQQQGTVCGIPLPAGLDFCQKLPEPIPHADDQGRPARRAPHARGGPRARRRGGLRPAARGFHGVVPARHRGAGQGRHPAGRHEVRVRRTQRGAHPDRRGAPRPTAPASGRRTSTPPARTSPATTSRSCATGWRPWTGTRRPPVPTSPTTWCSASPDATWRSSRRSPARARRR